MTPTLITWAVAVTAVLAAATLFAKSEFWRGLGRVICGVAWLLVGVLVAHVSGGFTTVPALAVLVSGLVTVGSGVRKFARRNSPQS